MVDLGCPGKVVGSWNLLSRLSQHHDGSDWHALTPHVPQCAAPLLHSFFQLAMWAPLPDAEYAAAREAAEEDPCIPVGKIDLPRLVGLAGGDSPLVTFFTYHPTVHVPDFYDDTPQGQEVRTR